MKYLLLSLFLLLSCAHHKDGQKTAEDIRLDELFEKHFHQNMKQYPEWATWKNYKDGIYNDRWSDSSLEGIENGRALAKAQRIDLIKIDRSKLSEEGKLNYDLYKERYDHMIEGFKFPGEYFAISQLGGFQLHLPQLLSRMPARHIRDYNNLLARFKTMDHVIDQQVALLKMGLKKGITPPKVTLRDVPNQFLHLFTTDIEKNPLTKPFRKFPKSLSEAEKKRILKEVKDNLPRLIAKFKEAHSFVKNDYIPNCRTSIAHSSLPNGKEWYNYEIKGHTTLDLTADEIHAIGLKEVKRIKGEMAALIKKVKYKGSFKSFLRYLRTNKKFYFTKKEDLLLTYRDIAKRADAKLLKVFNFLPRTPYGIEPTPAFMEKSAPTAYYNGGNISAGKPGIFLANTYDLKSRPKWEMVALTLHEAMPGHHLQISLAQELEDVPEFRKQGGYTAYVEGWGLYAESLGEEMEMYEDPYDKFGQLTYEMWRAIRLVVDTGMHAKGWSRQKAIDFFKDHAPKTEHDVIVEVDRYIIWPGQALSYKLGELKFKELRKMAKSKLGEKFDLREYHHQALKNGALPLSILEKKIDSWVEASL